MSPTAAENTEPTSSADADGPGTPSSAALQSAALEAIAAVRKLLDAAEKVVSDPERMDRVAADVEAWADIARRTVANARSHFVDTGNAGESEADTQRVRHLDLD